MKKSKKILLLSTSILLAGAVGIGVASTPSIIGGVKAATTTDVIEPYYFTGEEGTNGNYTVTNYQETSSAVYAGYVTYTYTRSPYLETLDFYNDEGQYIISTTSGGRIQSVRVSWNSSAGQTLYLNVYASNEPFTGLDDLTSNTFIAEISSDDASNTYTFTSSYSYVGITAAELSYGSVSYLYFTWDDAVDTADDAKDAAVDFAQSFLNNIGCDNDGVNPPTGDWDSFKTAYENLSEEAQAYLVEDVDDTIDEFLKLYDYIIGKYNYDNFLNRTITSASNSIISSDSVDYEVIIAVVTISVLVVVSASIYFIVKRRKQASK